MGNRGQGHTRDDSSVVFYGAPHVELLLDLGIQVHESPILDLRGNVECRSASIMVQLQGGGYTSSSTVSTAVGRIVRPLPGRVAVVAAHGKRGIEEPCQERERERERERDARAQEEREEEALHIQLCALT